jgi:hypothetical protein
MGNHDPAVEQGLSNWTDGTILPGSLQKWTEKQLEELSYKADRLHTRLVNGPEAVDWGHARLETECARKLLADENATDPDPRKAALINALRTMERTELAQFAMKSVEGCSESDIPWACVAYMRKLDASESAMVEAEYEALRYGKSASRNPRWRPHQLSWPFSMPKPLRELTGPQEKAIRDYLNRGLAKLAKEQEHSIKQDWKTKNAWLDLQKELDGLLSTYGAK